MDDPTANVDNYNDLGQYIGPSTDSSGNSTTAVPNYLNYVNQFAKTAGQIYQYSTGKAPAPKTTTTTGFSKYLPFVLIGGAVLLLITLFRK